MLGSITGSVFFELSVKVVVSYITLLPTWLYWFDAIGTQYVAQAKARKALKQAHNGEYRRDSEWQTSPLTRLILTVVFWGFGLIVAVSNFKLVGLFGTILITYGYGALPWVYFYHLKKLWKKYYWQYHAGFYGNDRRDGCFVVAIKCIWFLIAPVTRFVYALIFYVKDFVVCLIS